MLEKERKKEGKEELVWFWCPLSEGDDRECFSIMDIKVKFEYTIHSGDVSIPDQLYFRGPKKKRQKLTVSFHLLPTQVQLYRRSLGPYAHGSFCQGVHSRYSEST